MPPKKLLRDSDSDRDDSASVDSMEPLVETNTEPLIIFQNLCKKVDKDILEEIISEWRENVPKIFSESIIQTIEKSKIHVPRLLKEEYEKKVKDYLNRAFVAPDPEIVEKLDLTEKYEGTFKADNSGLQCTELLDDYITNMKNTTIAANSTLNLQNYYSFSIVGPSKTGKTFIANEFIKLFDNGVLVESNRYLTKTTEEFSREMKDLVTNSFSATDTNVIIFDDADRLFQTKDDVLDQGAGFVREQFIAPLIQIIKSSRKKIFLVATFKSIGGIDTILFPVGIHTKKFTQKEKYNVMRKHLKDLVDRDNFSFTQMSLKIENLNDEQTIEYIEKLKTINVKSIRMSHAIQKFNDLFPQYTDICLDNASKIYTKGENHQNRLCVFNKKEHIQEFIEDEFIDVFDGFEFCLSLNELIKSVHKATLECYQKKKKAILLTEIDGILFSKGNGTEFINILNFILSRNSEGVTFMVYSEEPKVLVEFFDKSILEYK